MEDWLLEPVTRNYGYINQLMRPVAVLWRKLQ